MSNGKNIFFYYKEVDDSNETLKPLIQAAEKYGYTIVDDAKRANLIVAIGGDGMFLQAVRKTGFKQDALYMGISQGDELALYCDFKMHEVDDLFNTIDRNDMKVRRFPIIEVTVNGESTFYCLNEVSVRSSIIKTIVIDVFIDDLHFETFRGDGLIVATPTGSTGYNKSTHGAVIDPLIPSFQVSEISSLNNNRYRTLGSSFVLGKERKLILKVVQDGNDYPIIGLDNEAYSIRNIKDVEVVLSDKVVQTIRMKDNSYWHRVKRTFL